MHDLVSALEDIDRRMTLEDSGSKTRVSSGKNLLPKMIGDVVIALLDGDLPRGKLRNCGLGYTVQR